VIVRFPRERALTPENAEEITAEAAAEAEGDAPPAETAASGNA
jgi:hypothetical protein